MKKDILVFAKCLSSTVRVRVTRIVETKEDRPILVVLCREREDFLD